MPDIVVNLNFSTDDGIPALFGYIGLLTPNFPATGTYDGTDGNPSGSITFATVSPADGGETYQYSQTLEGWGVPAGASVTNISLLTVDAKGESTGATFNYYPSARLRLGSTLDYPSFKESATAWNGNNAWEALTAEYGDTISYPIASTEVLNLQVTAAAGGGTSHQMWYDNLIFTITYGAGADADGTGVLLAQAARVSGSGDARMVVYATGALQAQAASIAGYSQQLPSVSEAIKENTSDVYSLLIDSVSIPMIKFTIRRNAETETALFSLPLMYEDIVSGGTVFEINLQSFDVYGAETNSQLFTGALDTFSTSIHFVDCTCSGLASWPANAVRDFGNVSYIGDDGNYNAYRCAVDGRFYPGDVGYYQRRRININRVTIVGNNQQVYMELANVGQV